MLHLATRRFSGKLPETVTRKQVLKTTTGGYDGHGQVVLNTDEKLSAAKSLTELSECVLERFLFLLNVKFLLLLVEMVTNMWFFL